MTPERFRLVEEIFHAALSRVESERAVFLAQACGGDMTLQRDVESLLAQPAPMVGFLEGTSACASSIVRDAEDSLLTNRRLGVYQVYERIGVGGMGEVYRARDTRLGRDVAIKILPSFFTSDPDRLARFDREARVLASLNHPHIAAIYGLEDVDGVPALVLEFVDGETLEDRIARGPVPVQATLAIARQVADALETAHEQGIVHRDLKPANIKIRSDGTVKVLDFGIAKILDSADARSDSLTTVGVTAEGLLIGTAPYMSPEQARGGTVTRRSDIWSFGAILFEMLTGRRTFAGLTTADVLAAILEKIPDWSALPPATPPAIAHLIRRCLEREPKARLHDIGDARLEIEDAERALRGENPHSAHAPAHRPASWLSRRRALVAAIVGAAALSVAAYIFLPRTENSQQEVRLQLPPPPGERFVSVPAVSPDGRHIVFASAPEAGGAARLWLRPLAAAGAAQLPGTDGASFPFWSADGRFVAFFADGQLKRVAVAGGNPVIVCEASAGRGGLWLDDDTIVFAPTSTAALVRVSAAGGQPMPFTTLGENETSHRFPQRLPGRQLLYFSVNRAPEKSGTRLVAIDDPGRVIAFVHTMGAAEYVKGFLVFVRSTPGDLVYPVLAQRMALPGGQLSGEPTEIGRARMSETLGRQVMATSPAGVVATLGRVEGIGQFTWVSRDGRLLETVGAPANQLGVELSPDGQQLATYRSAEIWTINVARPVPTRVTRGAAYRHPIWSPDGASVLSLFQGRGVGTFDLVTASLTTGEITTVRQATNLVKPVGWTRDGRIVWIEGGTSLWTMPTDGQPVSFLRDTAQIFFEARLSPDARWIAYATNRSGRIEIEVRSFPDPGQAYLVSLEGGGHPRWRDDGRELYFLSPNGRMMAVSFTPGKPPLIGTPAPLFEVKLIAHADRGSFATYEYDVNADGSRFLVNRQVSAADTSMAIIVDWNPSR